MIAVDRRCRGRTIELARNRDHDRARRNREGVAADPGFVHLHVHSSYSLLEGALTIARLAELAKADRQPALALTDTDNMFGALEFSEKMAGAGIQPIIGCSLAVDFGDQRARSAARPAARRASCRASCCWRRDEDGYRNLMRLSSRAFLETAGERAAASQARRGSTAHAAG